MHDYICVAPAAQLADCIIMQVSRCTFVSLVFDEDSYGDSLPQFQEWDHSLYPLLVIVYL